MKELAEANDTELASKLVPLATAYATWIEELEGRRTTEADLANYQEASAQVVARARELLARLNDGIALLEANQDARQAFFFRKPCDVAAAHSLGLDRRA